MAVDERSRLELADAAKRAFGDDAGITLMELLPPVGWADVATKHDLAALEARIDSRFGQIDAHLGQVEDRFDRLEERLELKFDAKFERGFRQVLVTVASLMVTGFAATIATVLTR
jgi:hypothetical protein